MKYQIYNIPTPETPDIKMEMMYAKVESKTKISLNEKSNLSALSFFAIIYGSMHTYYMLVVPLTLL